jgi:hypothetical protein
MGAKQSKRKAGSVAYLQRPNDGMYHLKVINLKISRERRREMRRICISFIWIQINRGALSQVTRGERISAEIGTKL